MIDYLQPAYPEEPVVAQVATIVAHSRQARLHLRKFHISQSRWILS